MPRASARGTSRRARSPMPTRHCARVLGRLEQLCAKDDAEQLMGRLLRSFNAVTGLSGWSDPKQASLTGGSPRFRPNARRRDDALQILRAAVDAVEPGGLVSAALSRTGTIARLPPPIFIVSAGKAAWPMARAFCRVDVPGVAVAAGIVAGPRGSGELPRGLEWFDASHPSPNRASETAGRRALAGAAGTRPGGSLVVLLSGGASSLLAVPAPGLSLEDKIATGRALMNAGVPIADLNCVRKHLSAIKGGRLAAEAPRSLTWAISDVHGPIPDDPSVIGSGPTVADPTTFAEALAVVRISGAASAIPAAVIRHLEIAADETPGPGDPRLANASYGSDRHPAGCDGGRRTCCPCQGLRSVGSERGVGRRGPRRWNRVYRARAGSRGPCAPSCLRHRFRGAHRPCHRDRKRRTEPGVRPRRSRAGCERSRRCRSRECRNRRHRRSNRCGRRAGGRNNGPAGGLVGVDSGAALANNAAYDFFRALGDLITWGPTGTNVGDVHVLLAG